MEVPFNKTMSKIFLLASLLLCAAIQSSFAQGSIADFYGIAYGDGLYVAVGADGETYVSTDGVKYSAVSYTQNPNSLHSVAFGNHKFVAVGDNGWSAVSTDGTNWQSLNVGVTTRTLYGIAFGGGHFVAVGDNGSIVTSPDGTANSWGLEPLSTPDNTNNLTAIAYGNGRFVALGADSNTCYVSFDGDTWVQGTNGLSGNLFTAVCAGNGIFVAANNSGLLFSSGDGTNWTEQAATRNYIGGIAFGNGEFVAAANNQSCYTSADGASWVEVASPQSTFGEPAYWYSILFNNGTFYFAGQGGDTGNSSAASLSATPALNWQTAEYVPGAFDTNDYLLAAIYGDNQFVAVGNDPGVTFSSPTGLGWLQGGLSMSGSVATGIAYGNGLYVVVNSAGQIFASPDGTTWSNTADSQLTLNAVAWGSNEFVAVGYLSGPVALTSTNGTVWTQRNPNIQNTQVSLRAILYDGSRFVAAGDNGTIATTTNGISWVPTSAPTSLDLFGIAHGNGLYVVVGQDGEILTSPDAKTWTQPINYQQTANILYGVTWTGASFIAVGDNGWTVVSRDGTNWTSENSATVNPLVAVAAGGGSVTAVGANGTILTIAELPEIISQPPAVMDVTNGAAVTLAVTNAGQGPFTYQWLHGGNSLSDGGEVSGSLTSTLTLSPASLGASGSYTLVISNQFGAVTSRVVQLNVGNPPVFITQPASQSPTFGQGAQFFALAQGSEPLTYQWTMNGQPISDQIGVFSGTESPILSLPHVYMYENHASLALQVSSPYGTAVSSPATINGVLEKTKPSISITSPRSQSRSSSITMSGTASDPTGIYFVHYTVAGKSANATLSQINSTTVAWSVPVQPLGGSNTLTVVAHNYSELTTTNSVSFTYLEPTTFYLGETVNVPVAPQSPVGIYTGTAQTRSDTVPAYGATELNVGESYTLTVTPSTNWHFVNWMSGSLIYSTNATVSFIMSPGFSLTAQFYTNSLNGAKGDYFGPFFSRTNTAGIGSHQDGTISLSLEADGAYTGRATFGDGQAVALSGSFTSATGSATNTFMHAGDSVTFTMNINFSSDGGSGVRIITGAAVGTTSSNGQQTIQWTSPLRLLQDGTIADLPGSTLSSPGLGKFAGTVFLFQANSNSQTPVPMGYGSGRLTSTVQSVTVERKTFSIFHPQYIVETTPVENLSRTIDWGTPGVGGPAGLVGGFTSDPTAFSQTDVPLQADGSLPIFVPGESNLISGFISVPTNAAAYPKNGLVTNENALQFLSAPNGDTNFPAGYDTGMNVIISQFLAGTVVPAKHGATLTLSGGGLTAPLVQEVSLSTQKTGTKVLNWLQPTNSVNLNLGLLVTTFDSINGTFDIEFTNAITGKQTAIGQVLPGKLTNFIAGGVFISSNRPGSIVITPNNH
jgi:hypothetical protein